METSGTAPPAEAASSGSRRPCHTRASKGHTRPPIRTADYRPRREKFGVLARGTTAPWAEKLGAGRDPSTRYRVGRRARSPSPWPALGSSEDRNGCWGRSCPATGGSSKVARMTAAPGFPGRGLCSRPGCDGRAAFSWLDFVLSRSWFAPRIGDFRRSGKAGAGLRPRLMEPGSCSPLGCFSIRNPFWPPTSENVPESRLPSGRVLLSHSTFKAELCPAALHELQLNLHLQNKEKRRPKGVVCSGRPALYPPAPQILAPGAPTSEIQRLPLAATVSPGPAKRELSPVVN